MAVSALTKAKENSPKRTTQNFVSSAGSGHGYLIFSWSISLLICPMLPENSKRKSFEKGHTAKAKEKGAKSTSIISRFPFSQEVEKMHPGQELGK